MRNLRRFFLYRIIFFSSALSLCHIYRYICSHLGSSCVDTTFCCPICFESQMRRPCSPTTPRWRPLLDRCGSTLSCQGVRRKPQCSLWACALPITERTKGTSGSARISPRLCTEPEYLTPTSTRAPIWCLQLSSPFGASRITAPRAPDMSGSGSQFFPKKSVCLPLQQTQKNRRRTLPEFYSQQRGHAVQ